MARPSVAIRLATEGKAQVKSDFAEIGQAGEAAAQRWGARFEEQSRVAERATQRAAEAARRVAEASSQTPTQVRVNQAVSTGFGDPRGTARESAQFFAEMEQRARTLLSAIDPLFAAQQRFNTEIAEARTLLQAGAITLDQYTRAELRAKEALDETTLAQLRNGASIGQARAGYQQLGFQIGDISQQLSLGINPLTVFGQQVGQVTQAVQLMTGRTTGFIGFMAGPWGAVLTGAITVLGMLLVNMRGAEQQTDKTQRSADRHKWSIQQLTEAIREQNAELQQQIRTSQQSEMQAVVTANANRREAAARLQVALAAARQTEALLAEADARAVDPTLAGEGGFNPGSAEGVLRSNQLQTIRARITELTAAITTAEQAARAAVAPIVERRVTEATDAAAAATGRYERSLGRLREELRLGRRDAASFQTELTRITAQRDREVEAAREADRRSRRSSNREFVRDATDNGREALITTAQQYLGFNENRGDQRAILQGFFRDAGINIDPRITAWCAAFVNAVLQANGLPVQRGPDGNPALGARQFLNYGQSVANPQRGDIVVLSRGSGSTLGHVGFFMGFDSRGNVQVLAGNQSGSRAVSVDTFDADRVIGFRRAPSQASAMTAEIIDWQGRRESAANTWSHELSIVRDGLTQEMSRIELLRDTVQGIPADLDAISRNVPDLVEAMRAAELRDLLRDGARDLSQGLSQAIFYGEDFGDALVDSLRRAGAEAFESGLMDLLNSLARGGKGRGGGGIFSLIGSFFGGGGGGGFDWLSSASALAPGAFALGTHSAPGGLAMVGEMGAELVHLPRGSKVSTASETRRLLAANDRAPSFTIDASIYAPGADSAKLAEVQAMQQRMVDELPDRVLAVWNDARERFVIR